MIHTHQQTEPAHSSLRDRILHERLIRRATSAARTRRERSSGRDLPLGTAGAEAFLSCCPAERDNRVHRRWEYRTSISISRPNIEVSPCSQWDSPAWHEFHHRQHTCPPPLRPMHAEPNGRSTHTL